MADQAAGVPKNVAVGFDPVYDEPPFKVWHARLTDPTIGEHMLMVEAGGEVVQIRTTADGLKVSK